MSVYDYGQPVTGITWTSSDTSIGTVSPSGALQAMGAGNANVTASLGGLSATMSLKVVSGWVAAGETAWSLQPLAPDFSWVTQVLPAAPTPDGGADVFGIEWDFLNLGKTIRAVNREG